MGRSARLIPLLSFLLSLTGCSSLATLDRDLLNHPAMDLEQARTPNVTPPLTGLGSARQGNASGGCTTCAH
jgi:hypothetical protein